jgi:quercetin dioxygenase-like cupin family protein
MSCRSLAGPVLALLAAAGFVACSEDAPVAPATMDHMSTDLAGVTLEPFTFRGPLDPFKIQQLPNFMIHSEAPTDIVIQRIVLSATSPFGMWHTHPGPSFVYVITGQTKLERFNAKDGCTETPVFNPGSVYFENANEVHRAVVVSGEDAVILVTRLNIPVGQAFTIPAADPGC